ncbi:MAG: endonuclease [Bacteroidales bacterium]
MLRKKLFFTSLLFIFSQTLFAQIPDGYYDSAEGLTNNQLKAALHDIIDDHIKYPYSDSGTDTWDILKQADKDPEYTDNVILIYTGSSVNAEQEYNNGNGWNREHVWAKSHGDFGTSEGAGTDAHHLKPSNIDVNGDRDSKDFDNGGTQHSVATECYYTSNTWEPRDAVKGDIARIMFYMAVRYEGDVSGEPDLELVDYITYPTSNPLFGKLSTLLEWHTQDPVDDFERNRNNVIYSYQNNRNPFIDHPEFVAQIWGGGENVPPSITNISISPQNPTSAESVTVSATITDADGTITSTRLNWGLSAGSLSNTINMSNSTGDNYVADAPIPAHADGTTVYYTIEAEDDSAAINTSTIQSYTVNDGGAVGLPFVEDFETVTVGETIDINGWTQYIEAGTETWEGREFDGNLYAQFSAYNTGETTNIGWLITPALDLTGYSKVIFSFKSKDGYNNGDPLEVFISTNYAGSGDPNGSSWIELNPTLSTGNSGGYATNWTASGDLYLNDYTGNTVYIAFKYTGGDPSLTTTMQIDDVLVEEDTTTNENPVISNVLLEPENPTDEDDVILSASVDDEDGNLESVMLKWKKNEEAYVEQDMNFAEGKYVGQIGKQPAGTTIHFIIQAKDDLGAETSYEDSFEVSEANAIEGVKINQAKIFPNPSTGRINIVIPGYTGKVDFKLYDAIGSLVFTETKATFNQKDMIYLQGVVSGIYLLKISANTGVTITRRLIIH